MSKNSYKVDMPEESYDDLGANDYGQKGRPNDDFDDEDMGNFDDDENDFGVSQDKPKTRPISGKQPPPTTANPANSKQIPLGNKKPVLGPKPPSNPSAKGPQPGLGNSASKPNFEKLKEGNLPPPKPKDPQIQIGSLKGESKPNLKIDPGSFGKGGGPSSNPKPSETSSKLFGMMSKPNLLVTASSTKSQGRPVYVTPDHPDYDPRSREEKMIDRATEYLALEDPETMEELKQMNKIGMDIFKEINDILTRLVDRQKPQLFAQVQRNPSAKSTTRVAMSMQQSRKKNLFELEFASGEKLLASVRHELDDVSQAAEKMRDPLFFENLKQEVYDYETIVKEKHKELEHLKTSSKVLGRKIDSKDKYIEQVHKKKALENDIATKVEKEMLVRDIISDDIQKKKRKLQEYEETLQKQAQEEEEIKSKLAELGHSDDAAMKAFKRLQTELQGHEKNLEALKKNWKGKLNQQKKELAKVRVKNEAMYKEIHELTQQIEEQSEKLLDLAEQEKQLQLQRVQEKLEYQAQLETMLLEREVQERELQYELAKQQLRQEEDERLNDMLENGPSVPEGGTGKKHVEQL